MSTERLPDGAAGMGDQCPGGAEAAVAGVGKVAAHRRRTASGADALTARERRELSAAPRVPPQHPGAPPQGRQALARAGPAVGERSPGNAARPLGGPPCAKHGLPRAAEQHNQQHKYPLGTGYNTHNSSEEAVLSPGLPVRPWELPANTGGRSCMAAGLLLAKHLCIPELEEARRFTTGQGRALGLLQAVYQCAAARSDLLCSVLIVPNHVVTALATFLVPPMLVFPCTVLSVQWPSKRFWMKPIVFTGSPSTYSSLTSSPGTVTQ